METISPFPHFCSLLSPTKIETDGRLGNGASFQEEPERASARRSPDGRLQIDETEDTIDTSDDAIFATIAKIGRSSTGTSFDELKVLPPPAKKAKYIGESNNQFRCELCHIGTSSRQLLDWHFNGAKHMKNLKQKN